MNVDISVFISTTRLESRVKWVPLTNPTSFDNSGRRSIVNTESPLVVRAWGLHKMNEFPSYTIHSKKAPQN